MRIVGRMGLGEPHLEDGAIVTAITPDDPSLVTRALAEQGVYLRALQLRRATLEEAFLKLTHHDEEVASA